MGFATIQRHRQQKGPPAPPAPPANVPWAQHQLALQELTKKLGMAGLSGEERAELEQLRARVAELEESNARLAGEIVGEEPKGKPAKGKPAK